MGCERDSQRTAVNSFTSRHENNAERMTLTGPHAADAVARTHTIGPRDCSPSVLPERQKQYMIMSFVSHMWPPVRPREIPASKNAERTFPRLPRNLAQGRKAVLAILPRLRPISAPGRHSARSRGFSKPDVRSKTPMASYGLRWFEAKPADDRQCAKSGHSSAGRQRVRPTLCARGE
jgi:hypothetical protein